MGPDLKSFIANQSVGLLSKSLDLAKRNMETTPVGDYMAIGEGLYNRNPWQVGLGALSLAIPGTIKPLSKADRIAALRAEANAQRFGKEIDYKGLHTAPIRQGRNSADDLADIYPADIYNPAVSGRFYGHGEAFDDESAKALAGLMGNPDATVTIYRAVPKGVNKINKGDWVTISPTYAKQHGASWVDGPAKVIKKKVKAKDIVTNGDSIHEWGYDP